MIGNTTNHPDLVDPGRSQGEAGRSLLSEMIDRKGNLEVTQRIVYHSYTMQIRWLLQPLIMPIHAIISPVSQSDFSREDKLQELGTLVSRLLI